MPSGGKDVYWIRPDGEEMLHDDWSQPGTHILGMLISGEAADETDARGQPITGDTLLVLLNGGPRPRHFVLPKMKTAGLWYEVINTAKPDGERVHRREGVNLLAHSLMLLRYGDGRRATRRLK
jgi:glycogen operon protein